MNAAKEMWDLFYRYQEHLGLSEEHHLEKACEFEDAFCALACKHLGHEIGPDQCNNPKHDYCWRCNQMASNLGFQRAGDWGQTRRYVPVEGTGP